MAKRNSSNITNYFGFITLLTGAVGGFVAMFFWLYKVWTNQTEFSWFTLVGIVTFSFLLAVIGYVLIRISQDR